MPTIGFNFVPHKKRIRKSPDKNATKPDEKKEPAFALTGYVLGRVFDNAQTDGEPLPEPPQAGAVNGESEIGMEIDRRLSRFLIEQGVRLSVEATGCARVLPAKPATDRAQP